MEDEFVNAKNSVEEEVGELVLKLGNLVQGEEDKRLIVGSLDDLVRQLEQFIERHRRGRNSTNNLPDETSEGPESGIVESMQTEECSASRRTASAARERRSRGRGYHCEGP